MANKSIKGITIQIDGETTGLQKSLGNVNKQAKDIQSELRQVDRLLKLDPKNTELIAQKQKLLSDAVSTTSEKLDKLKSAQEEVNEQFRKGEISEEQYRAFQRELIKTENDLKKFEQQLKETTKTSRSLGDTLKAAGDKMKAAGQKISGVGKTMTKSVTAPILGATAAVGALAVKAGQTADRLLDLRDITGLSTDSIQEWQYVANQAGVESETMTKAVEGLTRKIPQLEQESKLVTDQLNKLGISFADLKEMSPDEQVDTLMNLLAEMEDPLERNAIGAQLFGGAWKDLAPILGMGADGIAAVRQEARDLGIILDEDSIEKANEFRQQLDKLKATVSAIAFSIGAELGTVLKDEIGPVINDTIIPALKGMAEKIANNVKWFVDLDPKWQKVILAAVAFAAALGPLLIILGSVVTGIGALLPVLAAVVSPIGLVIAAVAALVAGLIYLWNTNEQFRDAVTKIWEAIKKVFEVAVNAISTVVKKAFEALQKFWDAWGKTILAIAKRIWDQIKLTVQTAINLVKDIIGFVLAVIRGDWEEAWNRVKSIFESVWNFIKGTAQNVAGAIKDISSGIVRNMKQLPQELLNIGRNMISNFAQGIRDRISNVTGAIGDVARKVRDFLPFSPAKEGPLRDIPDFTAHLVDPAKEALKELQSVMRSGMDKVSMAMPALSLEGAAVAGAAGTSIGNYRYGDIVIQNMNVRSDQDIKLIARELHTLQQQSARGRGMR